MTDKQPEESKWVAWCPCCRDYETSERHLNRCQLHTVKAELRRLHGENESLRASVYGLYELERLNAELVEALRTILNIALMDNGHWAKTIETEAQAALAKAQGENNDE